MLVGEIRSQTGNIWNDPSIRERVAASEHLRDHHPELFRGEP